MAALNQKAARKRWQSDTGAELIELALVLPILLIVVAGIIDFGFLFQRYEAITNAAREGARVAVLPNFADADVQERVRQYLDSSGLDRNAAVIPVPVRSTLTLPPGGTTVDVVTVEVRYPAQFSYLRPFLQLVRGNHPGQIMLRSTSVMRSESASTGGS